MTLLSYEELALEEVWRNERIPGTLSTLGRRLREEWNLSRSAVGMLGNNRHMSGYHRSRNWLRTSRHAERVHYSTTETPGNAGGGDGDHVSAMDLTLPVGLLVVACRRLDVAVREGRLEKITEWYGNVDGDGRVDGFDNIRNRVESSDPSHLWHLHMSFDRGRVAEDHDDVFQVLTQSRWSGPSSGTPGGGSQKEGWTTTMIGNAPLVQSGQKGPWVRTVQALCCARGATVRIDGNFLGQTESAVKSVQSQAGLSLIDGKVGPQTWPVLFTGSRAA